MLNVVLVDKKGEELGEMEKYKAHHNPGFLHKAISVVLYRTTQVLRSKFQETNKDPKSNDQNSKRIEILIQKRAAGKPLWPLFWANTVCTHPLPGEHNLDCAKRRLKEEVGIEMEKKDLEELYTFYYQANHNDELSEHELDTVIVGEYSGEFIPSPEEVVDARWVEWEELKKDLEKHAEIYAPWPKMIFNNNLLIKNIKEVYV